jgi:acyl carrier protein
MEKNEIIAKIGDILKTILKHGDIEVSENLSATDVDGWDSLTHMLIITEVEKQFNVKFKLKELNKLLNVGSLVELVHEKLNQ